MKTITSDGPTLQRCKDSKITRRKFVKKAVTVAISTVAVAKSPICFSRKKFRLRVLGTHVTLQEVIRQQAEKDLGIEIIFEPGGDSEILHKASTRPDSFDLYEHWTDAINVLWQANAIQPIDTMRLRYWRDVNELTKQGRISPQASFGLGDAPHKILYVQPNGKLGSNEQKKISFLPYVHNVDSIGYNAKTIPRGVPYETESWGWLLDKRYAGKVAIVNAPTIGLFDLALAVESLGLMKFEDMGSMSRTELDKMFKILVGYRKEGHFRGVWRSVPESVDFMKNDGVAVQSMFSPAVSTLNGEGINCVYAAPKEGYRAWHGVMCLSKSALAESKDAAYEFMNWWLSGWPGAFIARQGYYISTPKLSQKHLSEDEWNYWYDGKATQSDLKNPEGKIAIRAGEIRSGGSYENRFSRVAIWNTVMPNFEYTLLKWGEFLST